MHKILIADDSRFQVQVFSGWLAESGFAVVTSFDALQAWMTALRAAPDAIILDINMPAGSGIDVLHRLRMSSKTQQIPVVVVSGDNKVEVEKAARDLGVSEFLHKPVEREQLCNTLSRLLGQPGDVNSDRSPTTMSTAAQDQPSAPAPRPKS